MGLIAMSERDLQRIEVLSKVVEYCMTIVSARSWLNMYLILQVERLSERSRPLCASHFDPHRSRICKNSRRLAQRISVAA